MERSWVGSLPYRAAIAAIVEERTAAGVSQRELARRLGKPASFVNKIELLERRLDILEFVLIAEALEVPPANLFSKVLRALAKQSSRATRE